LYNILIIYNVKQCFMIVGMCLGRGEKKEFSTLPPTIAIHYKLTDMEYHGECCLLGCVA
jgi:hypothetical protein